MVQLPYDAYRSLARLIDPWERINVLDIGANIGTTVARALEEFYAVEVYALEPEPESFAKLRERFKNAPTVHLEQAAASNTPGERTLNVNSLRACSSLLDASEAGKRYYGEWYEAVRRVRVPAVRVDDWARARGLDVAHFVKLDVQGLELDVLRSAEGLISRGTLAINCEAPLVQEYEGASTFLDIACWLREHGFDLFQVHEMYCCGPEERTTCMDGLWLHRTLLEKIKAMDPAELEPTGTAQLRRVLRRCRVMGFKRVALYGAGKDLRERAGALDNAPIDIDCIIDDNPSLAGTRFKGLEILPFERAAGRVGTGFDCVVLNSGGYEAQMLERCEVWRERGAVAVPVRHFHASLMGRHPLIRPEHQLKPAARAGLLEVKPAMGAPGTAAGPNNLDIFHHPHYLALTAARLKHLASLGLDGQVRGKRVLEVGAGVGDLTGFFVERGCSVHATDVREANVSVIRERFAQKHSLTSATLDLEAFDPAALGTFDVVFCYGVLYHLAQPQAALGVLSRVCASTLLLETCVSYGESESINPIAEDAANPSQAMRGEGCRPTRAWVLSRLRELFGHVYVPRTQPAYPEFPLDWTRRDPSVALHRAVFVASRTPIQSAALQTDLPLLQAAA